MLLQTNSYVVPKERRSEHARIVRRFKQALQRLGCDQFEVYEQAGANWAADEGNGRFVQIMRFKDRRHQLAVQAAERNDPVAQAIIAEFCELINFQYQHQQGLFAIGYYTSILTGGRERDSEHAPPPVQHPKGVPAHPRSEQLHEALEHAEAPHAAPAPQPPIEIIEQATVLMDVPFADAPMHQPTPTADEPITAEAMPVNGDALSHDPSPAADQADPQTSARELDQMIRRHFGDKGDESESSPEDLLEDLNGHADKLRDLDLDEAFAAELMDSSDSLRGEHPDDPADDHSRPTHAHAPPIEEFDRGDTA